MCAWLVVRNEEWGDPILEAMTKGSKGGKTLPETVERAKKGKPIPNLEPIQETAVVEEDRL